MEHQVKYLLDESEMPRQWYNVIPDLPSPRRRRCTRAPGSRSGPKTWPRCSPWR